jgi:acetyl esterase
MAGVSSDEPAAAEVPGVADEGLARWVARVRQADGPPCRAVGAERLREAARNRAANRPRGPGLPLVQDLTTGEGRALRLYRPGPEPLPLVLYLHGGGFVMHDLDTFDGTCRQLARTANVAVLAVDFRRPPEHPGPAAVEDAVSAAAWAGPRLRELGGDPSAGIGLAGDSSGGAIAVLAAIRLRDRRGDVAPPSALLLAYPNADMTLSEPSVQAEGRGWGLETDDLRWFVEQWVPDPRHRANPAVSPVHADLAGLPPVMIATAEHDPLRDEDGKLARLLAEAGTDVSCLPHPGLVHGFLGLAHCSPACARARDNLFARFGGLVRGQTFTMSRSDKEAG